MNNFPNGAGLHDYEDVNPPSDFIDAQVYAHTLLKEDRARRITNERDYWKMIWYFVLVMLVVGMLIYAMHGDQVALNNGFIH